MLFNEKENTFSCLFIRGPRAITYLDQALTRGFRVKFDLCHVTNETLLMALARLESSMGIDLKKLYEYHYFSPREDIRVFSSFGAFVVFVPT